MIKNNFIKLNSNNFKFPEIIMKISIKNTEPNFHTKLYKLLFAYKNKINDIKNSKIWDYYKKLTNEYELIHVKNKFNSNVNIAKYEPISRSYFKLWEIIKDFDLIKSKKSINILCLAEGPGGFAECILNVRNNIYNISNDKCTCITLKSYKNDIPGWKKSKNLFEKYPNLQLTYGIDKTGNIYNLKNIKYLISKFNNSIDFITADGGFDFSVNYNKQEQLSHRLLICEIIIALGCLKNNGDFVLKFFDIFTKFTVEIIYFLTKFFKNIYITKPYTSRSANSEKYLICKNFLGISKGNLEKLYYSIDDWAILSKQNKFVNTIFEFKNKIPNQFYDLMKSYNFYIVSKQIINILKTLIYINADLTNKNINQIKQEQTILALTWCKKYNIPINYTSIFLKKNINHYNYIPNFVN